MRGRRDPQKPLLRLPAVQALLLQCLSLGIVLLLMIAASSIAGLKIPLIAAVWIQGACAAGLSSLLRLDPWWLLMQFVFPPALLAGLALHLPPEIYLLAFLFFLLLFWTTFRSQVPFYPSGPAVWRAVALLLPQSRPIRFIDVGSGFGGLVSHLALLRPDSTFVGIEVAPLPWAASRVRAAFAHSAGIFLRGDYNQLNFADFDVIFAYLSPVAMPALWTKACAEMRPGTLLLSYEFDIPGVQSQITKKITVSDGRILHGWNM